MGRRKPLSSLVKKARAGSDAPKTNVAFIYVHTINFFRLSVCKTSAILIKMAGFSALCFAVSLFVSTLISLSVTIHFSTQAKAETTFRKCAHFLFSFIVLVKCFLSTAVKTGALKRDLHVSLPENYKTRQHA